MEAAPLVHINHRVRSAAFGFCFAVIGLYLWQRGGAGPVTWALLALQFLVYPHLLYWRALRSAQPARAELDNLFLDAVLLGAWCAELGFPTWITYFFVGATTLNAVVNRGARGARLVARLHRGGRGAVGDAAARRVRAADERSRHRAVRRRLAVLRGAGRHRGAEAEPPPRRGARRAARERGALSPDRRERGRPHRHARPRGPLALRQPVVPAHPRSRGPRAGRRRVPPRASGRRRARARRRAALGGERQAARGRAAPGRPRGPRAQVQGARAGARQPGRAARLAAPAAGVAGRHRPARERGAGAARRARASRA